MVFVAADSPWVVSRNDLQSSEKLFREAVSSTNSGYVSGLLAKKLLGQSGLPTPYLRAIWDLADMDKDGALNQVEFVVAMHLISKAKSGFPLPSSVPVELRNSASGAGVKDTQVWGDDFDDFSDFTGAQKQPQGAADASFGVEDDDFGDFAHFENLPSASGTASRPTQLSLSLIEGHVEGFPNFPQAGVKDKLDDILESVKGAAAKPSPVSKAAQLVEMFAESIKPQPKMRDLKSPKRPPSAADLMSPFFSPEKTLPVTAHAAPPPPRTHNAALLFDVFTELVQQDGIIPQEEPAKAADEEFGDFVSDASFADFNGASAAGAALSLSTAFPNLSGAIPNHEAAASDELDADFGAFDGPATSAVAAVTGVGEEAWGGRGRREC